jgi:hypothetical protein
MKCFSSGSLIEVKSPSVRTRSLKQNIQLPSVSALLCRTSQNKASDDQAKTPPAPKREIQKGISEEVEYKIDTIKNLKIQTVCQSWL